MHKAATRTGLAAACALWLTVLALVFAPPAAAAPSPGDGAPSLLGNDVSWPQCNKALPKGAAFGIVGVNNGLANTTNPCLKEQLAWAGDPRQALTGQPRSPCTSIPPIRGRPARGGPPTTNTRPGLLSTIPTGRAQRAMWAPKLLLHVRLRQGLR